VGIPIAADDEDAKRVVAGLVEQIGFDPVDAGSLRDGRDFQPGSDLFAADLPGRELRDRLAG
jgi:8-hydroxy-5-deazaflavin:NADPH oxidoreductase